MNTVEIFCGTKSFSKVAESLGHRTFTVDLLPKFEPDVCADVRLWQPSITQVGGAVDVLWLSPPCQGFSVAQIGRNWHHDGTPKTETAKLGVELVKRAFEIIDELQPTWWFMENPRGKLRALKFMQDLVASHGGHRQTVTYCQYGDTRMKPTDIWTNVPEEIWKPKPICGNGDPCHEPAPRGSPTGTQGLKNAAEKGRIPPALFEEIFSRLHE